jgi:hypothetical protein
MYVPATLVTKVTKKYFETLEEIEEMGSLDHVF